MMAAVAAAVTLGELLGAGAMPGSEIEIADLALDSRQVVPGAAFVAVGGAAQHGALFIDEALGRGAAAVLVDPAGLPAGFAIPARESVIAVPQLRARLGEIARRFYWRDRPQPALSGVTGTNGKTTVAWLVAQAMQQAGRDCAYVGTLGYGRPGALAAQQLTTPDCLTLHRQLFETGAAAAAIEVSSHGLEQDRVAGLDFRSVAVTNLSRDHLDAHGSMAAYGRVKARIMDLPGVEAVVLNIDDAFAAGLVARAGAAAICVSRRDRSADISADVDDLGLDGLSLAVTGCGSAGTIRSPLIGDFNAENLLVALGLLVAEDMPLAAACNALSDCRPAPGRLEMFAGHDGIRVAVDYAHTPAALERALEVVGTLGNGRTICVFGCGGDRDRGKRALMGRAAGAADHVVLTDDNPRGEDPARIVDDIVAGLRAGQPVTIEHDRILAIRQAMALAAPGDVVLVAGKGHETTQVSGSRVAAMDDRRIVRDELASRQGAAS